MHHDRARRLAYRGRANAHRQSGGVVPKACALCGTPVALHRRGCPTPKQSPRPARPLLFNHEAVVLSSGRLQRSCTSRTTHQSTMLDLRGSCIHLSRAALVPSLLPAFRREAADAFSPGWSEAQPRVTHLHTCSTSVDPSPVRRTPLSCHLCPPQAPPASLQARPSRPNPCLPRPSALFLKYFQNPYKFH